MIQVLSYFRPLHKAVSYHCNLCGKQVGDDEYQTANARRLEAQEREGQYVFCNDCSPHINEIVQEIAHTEAQLSAQAQQDIASALADRARELLANVNGAAVVSPPPSVSSVSPPDSTQRRRPSTRIPAPR